MAAASERQPRPGGARWTALPCLFPAVAASLALAALSLLAPFTPAFDPWAWLVWGREIGGLELDTSAGPSWKPLPTLLAVPLAALGDAADEVWLLLARAGWLMALALAWRLAARLADPDGSSRGLGLAAGAIAALALLLLEDSFTPWLRQFAGGLSEPLLAALVLAVVDRDLDGHSGQALVLGTTAALLRPEAWPFLAAYAILALRRRPSLMPLAGSLLALVPLLWFVPDLLGAGDPLEGARRAREGTGPPAGEALEAIERAMSMLPIAIWIAAALEAVRSARAGERRATVLALVAVAWILVVAAMAAGGYAGLPRFMAPAAALACVLGGAGIARAGRAAIERLRAGRAALVPLALAAALAIGFGIQGALRAAELPGDAGRAAELSEPVEAALEISESVGSRTAAACGGATTTELLLITPLAWQLELPLSAVRLETEPRGRGLLVVADASAPGASDARPNGARLLARSGELSAYDIGCETGSAPGKVAYVGRPR